MRQKTSVFMLFAGQTVLPLLAICLVMGAAQWGLFLWAIQKMQPNLPWFGEVVNEGHLHYVFSGAFFALLLLLYQLGQSTKSKTGYLMQRLRLPLWQVGVLLAVNMALAMVILWGAQLVILRVMGQWYFGQLDPTSWSHQTFALECYRCPLLHSLLPLSNFNRWLRNGLMVVALAVSGGMHGVRRWQGQGSSRYPFILMAFAAVTFTSRPGSGWDAGHSIFYIVMIIWWIGSRMGQKEEVNHET